MEHLIGLLTAVKNTAIPMTVVSAYDDVGNTHVECTYVVNGKLEHFGAHENAFIGFGDTLTFTDGSFVEAYFAAGGVDVEDDDEDDEDDEDETDDTDAGADHEEVRN